MTPEDYVSYPLALALKKAGFDEPCDHYYCAFDNETDVRFWSIHPAQSQNGLRTPNDTVVADAPTLAVAQKWLREKKGIVVAIGFEPIDESDMVYTYTINRYNPDGGKNVWDCWDTCRSLNGCGSTYSGGWDSYEQALSAGIADALELIEEKGE